MLILFQGEKVGELFLKHSSNECADPESFKCRMSEIISSALERSVTLEQVSYVSLLCTDYAESEKTLMKLQRCNLCWWVSDYMRSFSSPL
jgi:hypothetical protein